MVPIALLYVKNWEEECCEQKKEEFREQFRESIQTLSAILKVGYSVEIADRVKEEDVENFVTVFGAAKRLGGDSIAIIRHAADAIGEKMEVEREIQVMLTSKKLEFKIMCVIPFVIILYMRSAFPEFMAVLYGNLAGTLFMTICLMVYLTAYQLGKKMTQIEV